MCAYLPVVHIQSHSLLYEEPELNLTWRWVRRVTLEWFLIATSSQITETQVALILTARMWLYPTISTRIETLLVRRHSPLFFLCRFVLQTWWCFWPALTSVWRSVWRSVRSCRVAQMTTLKLSIDAWLISNRTPSPWLNSSKKKASSSQ